MERMSTLTTRIGILRHSSCSWKTLCTKSGVGSQEVIPDTEIILNSVTLMFGGIYTQLNTNCNMVASPKTATILNTMYISFLSTNKRSSVFAFCPSRYRVGTLISCDKKLSLKDIPHVYMTCVLKFTVS